MRRFFVVFLSLLACKSAFATDALNATFSKKLLTFANLAATAMLAQKNCPGVKYDNAKLAAVLRTFDLLNEEGAVLSEFVSNQMGTIAKQAQQLGRAEWCFETWGDLGVNGKVYKDVLLRSD